MRAVTQLAELDELMVSQDDPVCTDHCSLVCALQRSPLCSRCVPPPSALLRSCAPLCTICGANLFGGRDLDRHVLGSNTVMFCMDRVLCAAVRDVGSSRQRNGCGSGSGSGGHGVGSKLVCASRDWVRSRSNERTPRRVRPADASMHGAPFNGRPFCFPRRSPAARRVALALAALLSLAIGVSRVYLGSHYPTDVIGGLLLGSAWSALSVLWWERRERLR